MFGSIVLLFLVPWLDSSPVRSARFRPLYRYFFWVLVVDVLLLGFCGAHPPEAPAGLRPGDRRRRWLLTDEDGAAASRPRSRDLRAV